MADIENLGLTSITEQSNDEALEHLRQIRLSRRTPKAKSKKNIVRKPTKPATMSASQAAELLKLLEEE